MTLLEKFESQPWIAALSYRKDTFKKMIEHFEIAASLGFTQLIETGTARVRGNWQGDGQSTLIWDWLASELSGTHVLSIDRDQRAVDIASEQTEHVDFQVGDSLEVLPSIDPEVLEKVGLLYLDSLDFEWGQPNTAAQHTLGELLKVWDHLPSGCMIAVDDCHSPYAGKHTAVAAFMSGQGIAPAFTGYQMAWVKP
jgi:hypothetical protein